MVNVEQAVERLGLTIERRLDGGVFGATLVRSPGAARAVLKLLPDRVAPSLDAVAEAAALAGGLRGAGYPIPAVLDLGLVDGTVFTLQEYVAGEVPDRITEPVAARLVELWDLHREAAPDTDDAWAVRLVDEIRAGVELRPQLSDPRAVAVLDRAVAIGRSADPDGFRTGDVVHGDFHTGNVLVDDHGRLAAVIDWEGTRIGDARFDLVRLWTGGASVDAYDPAASVLIKECAEASVPTEVWRVCGARIALDHLRFATFVDPESLPWVLREAALLLR
ncbi:aminoglycoside phosphotransferase family protein [Microlunatus sp. GCM10028923]|uniref:aminoglycoside phosphotransferase family protein n=1 Tax=Microlunatus sp. GCM10028923 TaxID=3273400 RepID=UPI00360DAC9E